MIYWIAGVILFVVVTVIVTAAVIGFFKWMDSLVQERCEMKKMFGKRKVNPNRMYYAYEEEKGHIAGMKLDEWEVREHYQHALDLGWSFVKPGQQQPMTADEVLAHYRSNTPVDFVHKSQKYEGVHIGFSQDFGKENLTMRIPKEEE